jgi:23S rRNA pseudouridine1911/1915/1917 synthase
MARESFVAAAGRLDVVVSARLAIPRAKAQRAIAQGRVAVDGRARPKSFRLEGGERIEVELLSLGALEPDPSPVRVLFEDPYLMVVSKPAGVVTHPTAARRTGTLVNRLLAMGTPLSEAGGADRPGIVHRLDAGTSGAMLVAKDDRTHDALAQMFRRHAIERRYLALVRGRVGDAEFLVDAPLARRRSKIGVQTATGREAATEVSVRERLGRATLVEARPRTGRTHQIRVHLSAIGHPVLGDRVYGGGGDDAARLGLSRPFLHSWRLAFDHPITGVRIDVEDPLPDDLDHALRLARREESR